MRTCRPSRKTHGPQLISAAGTSTAEIVAAFDRLKRAGAQAVIVGWTLLFNQARDVIIEQAARRRMPAIYSGGNFYTDAGGLISYGLDETEWPQRLAQYVDRIFKGAKPADLPVELPSKFDLVINLKTARSRDLSIPQAVLTAATRVIE